jgi:hypothetical protein
VGVLFETTSQSQSNGTMQGIDVLCHRSYFSYDETDSVVPVTSDRQVHMDSCLQSYTVMTLTSPLFAINKIKEEHILLSS